MQEASHHGKILREYRELHVGISQEELARRIGKSRRTIITLEQSVRINDPTLRRTLAWALQIPPALLGLSDTTLPEVASLSPLASDLPVPGSKRLSRFVFDTFHENLRMRWDLYYLGSATAADRDLNKHIGMLTQLAREASSKDRPWLVTLLSQNYQLKGMIARDQLGDVEAERCFERASLLAQEAESTELNALAMARKALVYGVQNRLNDAAALHATAREIAKRSSPALRAYLANSAAEVEGMLGNQACLRSIAEAQNMLRRIDPDDDPLLLSHSTRCNEQAINGCLVRCNIFLGKPGLAIEYYEQLENKLDLSMTRTRGRLFIWYAEALYANKELSCCFYAEEGLKLARSIGSQNNIHRVKLLAFKLAKEHPHDERVKRLLKAVQK